MTRAWLGGLAAGYGIAVPLGAIAVLVVSLAARTSFRVGAAAGAGAATADLVYAAVAASTGYALAPLLERVAGPLRLIGAAVLAGLAGHGLRAAWLARAGTTAAAARPAPRPGRAYLSFVGLTLLNPLTVLYFAALVIGRHAAVFSAPTAAAFVAGAFLASLSWQLLLASLGAALHRTGLGASRLWTGLLGNALVVVFAVRLAVGA